MPTHHPHLSPVDNTEPPRTVPTPRDILPGSAERLEAGIAALADAVVAAVPVVDLPARVDVPVDHPTFMARVTSDMGVSGTDQHLDIAGVTSWREHEGRLDLYGPVDAGQVTRIASIAPFAWKSVERLDRFGRAR